MHVLIVEKKEDGTRWIRCQCGFPISCAPAVLENRIHGMDRDDFFSEVRLIHIAHRSKMGCSDYTAKQPDPFVRARETEPEEPEELVSHASPILELFLYRVEQAMRQWDRLGAEP